MLDENKLPVRVDLNTKLCVMAALLYDGDPQEAVRIAVEMQEIIEQKCKQIKVRAAERRNNGEKRFDSSSKGSARTITANP